MAHEVETMAYNEAQVPWHGLGKPVSQDLTPEEMGVAAGLDWTVSTHPSFIEIDGERIDTGRCALVRDSDNSVLTNVGPGWKPTQNADMLKQFKEYCEFGGAKMETAGSLRSGRNVWALANLGVGFNLPGGDKTDGYLLFSNAHELGKAIDVRVTSVRVVCANTMRIAVEGETKSGYRQNHMSKFKFEEASKVVEMARDSMVDQGHLARKLLKVEFGRAEVMEFMHSLISEDALSNADLELFDEDPGAMLPRMAGLMNSYESAPGAVEGNAWGVLNGVTHFVDHVAARSADARLASAWFGLGDVMKTKALTKLKELV